MSAVDCLNNDSVSSSDIPPNYDDVISTDDMAKGAAKELESAGSVRQRSGNPNAAYVDDTESILVEMKTKDAHDTDQENGDDKALSTSFKSGQKFSKDDEKMLSVLREVAQKCTLANPLKRPTADEVVHILKSICPPGFDDDDDDFDDVDEMSTKQGTSI